jgi:hypothetical protein
VNLRTQFKRIIKKAGLKAWERPCDDMQLAAIACENMQNEKVTPTGFERVSTNSEDRRQLGKSAFSSGAKSGALFCNLPPDLARVVSAWPSLPATVKAAVLELVEAGG